MATSTPLAIQLQLYGDQIPFIRNRHYTAFLPRKKHESGKSIQDEWDVLAILIECSDERIDRVVVREGTESFVRVKIYNNVCTGGELTKKYLIPIPRAIVDRLLDLRFIEETSRSLDGHIDQAEFRLTALGMSALVGHIRSLQKRTAF